MFLRSGVGDALVCVCMALILQVLNDGGSDTELWARLLGTFSFD